jgi:hypothetical protein
MITVTKPHIQMVFGKFHVLARERNRITGVTAPFTRAAEFVRTMNERRAMQYFTAR